MNISYQQSPTLEERIFSDFLQREVGVSTILPLSFDSSLTYDLLLFNDGQDFPALNMEGILKELQVTGSIRPILVVGIHASADRIYEYGACIQPDYANRGNKAGLTRDFVLFELLPWLRGKYTINETNLTYAGFSLGGLMALDIAWNHSELFNRTAVFSGALWWRKRAIDDGYNDADRIMHSQIRDTQVKPDLKFWFQCGGKDETDDRDSDGIIDSIQDTLECISELERKKFRWGTDVNYFEMPLGEHNLTTWATAMPVFLRWAFGNKVR